MLPSAPKRPRTGLLTVSQSSSHLGTVLVPRSSSPDVPAEDRIPDDLLVELFGEDPDDPIIDEDQVDEDHGAEEQDDDDNEEMASRARNPSPECMSDDEFPTPMASSPSPPPTPPRQSRNLPANVTRGKDGSLFFHGR